MTLTHHIPRTPARAVGTKIVELRTTLGMSQRDLAHLAVIHPSNLGRLERGTANPNIDTLARIAVALGSTVSILTAEVTPPAYVRPPAAGSLRVDLAHGTIGHSSSLPSG